MLVAANQLFIARLCFQPHLGLRGLWGKRQVTYDVRWLTRSSQKHYWYLKDLCSGVVSLKGHFIAQAPLHLHRRISGLCHMLNIYLGCLVWKQLACCPFKCSLQSDLNYKDVLVMLAREIDCTTVSSVHAHALLTKKHPCCDQSSMQMAALLHMCACKTSQDVSCKCYSISNQETTGNLQRLASKNADCWLLNCMQLLLCFHLLPQLCNCCLYPLMHLACKPDDSTAVH